MPKPFRFCVLLIAAFGAAGFGGLESLFAPKAELWDRWSAHDNASTATIDHGGWQRFLDTYVRAGDDGVNRVAYGRVSPADHTALDRYIGSLTNTRVTRLSRAEQLPYWINLYNALTVKVILTHYPVKSIRDIDISPGLFGDGPWRKKLVEIEGEPVSLDDIEHRIIRPIWRDPRIHYAVNCAAVGCPNLQTEAFTPANTEELFEKAAREFVNHPRGISADSDRVVVSSIYAWFTDDFGGDLAGVVAHLKRYADPAQAIVLEEAAEFEDAYDWSLNDDAIR